MQRALLFVDFVFGMTEPSNPEGWSERKAAVELRDKSGISGGYFASLTLNGRPPVEHVMKLLIVFAVLCPLVQGCVGIVAEKTRTKEIDNPAVSFYPGASDMIRKQSSPADLKMATYTTQCTSEWLQQYWGSPSCISHASGTSEEVWTYKYRRVWEGVVPFVIVPIPLLLPVGREQMSFRLRDGQVVSASNTKSVWVGQTYGFIPNPEGGGGWGVWSWTDSWKGVP